MSQINKEKCKSKLSLALNKYFTQTYKVQGELLWNIFVQISPALCVVYCPGCWFEGLVLPLFDWVSLPLPLSSNKDGWHICLPLGSNMILKKLFKLCILHPEDIEQESDMVSDSPLLWHVLTERLWNDLIIAKHCKPSMGANAGRAISIIYWVQERRINDEK